MGHTDHSEYSAQTAAQTGEPMGQARSFGRDISRRNFCGAALAGAAVAAVAGMSGNAGKAFAQAASAASGAQSYTPGTYTSTQTGRNGDVVLTATFSSDKLESLDVEQSESRNIGDFAIATITQRCLDGQTLNLDTITGATISSMAMKLGLEDVFTQAGGDIDALEAADKGYEDPEAIDETADIVIVGTGGAAFAAAVTAAEAGCDVVMLDKMDIIGGNTNAGEGTLNAPDPDRQEPQGVDDSVDHFFQDTWEGGDETADPELVELLTNHALDAVHFMEDHGLVYKDEVFTAIGGKWCRGHAVQCEKNGEQGGSYYVSNLRTCAEKLGVRIYPDAHIDTLLTDDDGKVYGVSGTRADGNTVMATGKAVILATGGYANNAKLAMQYDKRVTEDMPTSNVCSSTGEGIALGQSVGADLMNMELVQIHPLGDPQNGGVATFVGNWLGVEDYLMVNDNGERFINEDGRRDEIANAILEQPNKEMWLLVDSTDIEDDRADQIADLVATGHSFQADDIPALAEAIDVDGDALSATVDAYNKIVSDGVDPDFGKELLGTDFSDAPFFASKRICTIHYTMGGLKIDKDAQVVNTDGTPIEGLYACGECTGGIQGSNRLGGNSFTDLIVFGRIAGTSASTLALEA